MGPELVKRMLLICVILLLPAVGYAQEATITGIITDSTESVLPGVTVTAVHEATGNTFVAVTDGTGRYLIPVRIGGYRITAELSGFTRVERSGVQLLVGQTATINIQMAPSAIQETVTVTAEAPLLDIATSEVGGNIDPRQMQELPVQGRGWTTLALLAPGNRTTAIGVNPIQDARHDNREFQLNMDGQQVTNNLGTGDQPRFSRDVIAEFQFISNRFDATQGRSTGVQVNAVTKSGTNQFAGLGSGYYRNDRFNADDHVLNRKRPVDIQQYSTTFGGPIMRDRFHFFAHYEHEREPLTSIWNTPFPAFNITLTDDRTVNIGGLRLDYQFTPRTRLMAKANLSQADDPFGPGSGSNHPASTSTNEETTGSYQVELNQVLTSRALNTVKVGYANYSHGNVPLTRWSNHPQAFRGVTNGGPRIVLRGFNITGNLNHPRVRIQDTYSIRDDLTVSYTARGRHDLKVGGEYLFDNGLTNNCSACMGQIVANAGPVPANLEALFPDPFNADTWNLAALSPITRFVRVGTAEEWGIETDLHKTGLWVQDDWHMSSRFTLNLGLRWDYINNAFSQDAPALLPWMQGDRSQDATNIQPRLGFAYQVDDRTVVRGGAGRYYADIILAGLFWPKQPAQIARLEIRNDGRPDFAANPLPRGLPSKAEADQRFCDVTRGAPGCLIRGAQELAPPAGFDNITNTWQTSVGVQRQLSEVMVLEADYVYNRGRDQKVIFDNINLTFDPATGVNRPFSNRSTRFDPNWGIVGLAVNDGWSNYHALQTAFTKRLRDNWQASATYTLGGFWTGDPRPFSGSTQVTFPVPSDLGGEYTLAPTDQRHRFVFNGIWQVGYGFQVSGLYFYGSGERDTITSGAGDVRDLGEGPERLRLDGTITPRGTFVAESIHRVDLRLQQRIPISRVRVDGILEMYNLFDRANFGSYDLEETSRRFLQPEQSANLAYAPFTMQLGFRVTF